jgi:hypothetical protein
MNPTLLILSILAGASGLICAQEAHGNPKQAFEQLMEKARDAKNAGQFDESRELSEKAEKLRREMHELRMKKPQQGPPEKKPDAKHAQHPPMKGTGPGPERFEHVMQAVKHLHAAGMHDVAEKLQRMAESVRHEMQEHMKREHAAERSRKKPMLEAKPTPQKKLAPDPQPSEQVKKLAVPAGELAELHQQLRRLQEQVERLAGEVKKEAQPK